MPNSKIKHKIQKTIFAIATLAVFSPTFAAVTNVINNGSFETPGGWLTGTSPISSAGTQCSFNIAAPAPGTETATSTAGFAATDNTNVALGSIISTSNSTSISDCVYYQDVNIPAGATTAKLSYSIAYKLNGGKPDNAVGVTMGLYSTSVIPSYNTAPLTTRFYQAGGNGTSSPTLVSGSSASINIATLAGTTVRFAYILSNANSTSTTGSAVAGLDNLSLNVQYAPTAAVVASIPTLSQWAMLFLSCTLAFIGFSRLARHNKYH